jgi:hypothetical protein
MGWAVLACAGVGSARLSWAAHGLGWKWAGLTLNMGWNGHDLGSVWTALGRAWAELGMAYTLLAIVCQCAGHCLG